MNLRQKFPNLPRFPKMASAMKQQQFAAVANGYLKELTAMSPTAVRVTDKLLTNYYFVGLINTLFPNAKIIHTMRNPVDTCWSAYTKLFKDDMPHSYDFGELGRYYKKYEEMMAHWDKCCPRGSWSTCITRTSSPTPRPMRARSSNLLDCRGTTRVCNSTRRNVR